MFRNILLVMDPSEGASRCARECVELARTLSARLRIVFVMSPLPAVACAADFIGHDTHHHQAVARATSMLSTVAAMASSRGVPVTTSFVVDTRHAVAIVDAAEHGDCDLVVLYGHPRDARSLRHIATDVITDNGSAVLVYP